MGSVYQEEVHYASKKLPVAPDSMIAQADASEGFCHSLCAMCHPPQKHPLDACVTCSHPMAASAIASAPPSTLPLQPPASPPGGHIWLPLCRDDDARISVVEAVLCQAHKGCVLFHKQYEQRIRLEVRDLQACMRMHQSTSSAQSRRNVGMSAFLCVCVCVCVCV